MMQGLSRRTRRAMRRARRRRGSELNIVNFIDVLTVLVFFLLVNSTGVAILGVNLPADAKAVDTPPPHALSVVIRGDGLTVADNGVPIKTFPKRDGRYPFAALARLMQQIKQRLPDQTRVLLLSTPDVAYDRLVKLMDAVREQPTPDGRGEMALFPDIAIGDAPSQLPVTAR